MSLFELCIRRPVFATVLSLVVLVIGLISYSRLAVREYSHRRAGRQRADDLSGRLGRGRRVAGHQDARGLARRHRGRRADDLAEPLGAQRHQRALHAVARSRLGGRRRARQGARVRARLPRERRRAGDRQGRGGLVADHLDRRSQAGSSSALEASDYVKRYIKPRLSVLPGAADVRIFGERKVSMRINLDRDRLAGYKLTLQDVEDALRRQNVEIPSGRIESSAREFTVVAETDVQTPEQFET